VVAASIGSGSSVKFVKFMEEWSSATFRILLHPRTPLAITSGIAKPTRSIVNNSALKFAASSIILANTIFTLVSTLSVKQVVSGLPFLLLLLVGWIIYSFINHFVLWLLGGKASERQNISHCFLLMSAIYVISVVVGVGLAVGLHGSSAFTYDSNELFVAGNSFTFVLMNIVYFPIVLPI
jgi:hypothetical protein